LFEIAGVFNEQLPICEDYDLWLRVAAQFEVGFLAKPLIAKRGGHSDQLSHSEFGIDRYRVTALLKIYESGILKNAWQQETAAMIRAKSRVLANGFRKRQKVEEAAFYERLPERLPR
jgi:hypothetical protein